MLSAVLQLLYGIQKETSRERKRAIIDLCAAAYPDVRPWQAKKSCHASQPPALRDEMSNWYYTYLSLLLHPTDGHDAARRDPPLVKVSRFLAAGSIASSPLHRHKDASHETTLLSDQSTGMVRDISERLGGRC